MDLNKNTHDVSNKTISDAIIAANSNDPVKANKIICDMSILDRLEAAPSFIQNEIERIKNDPNYSYSMSRSLYG